MAAQRSTSPGSCTQVRSSSRKVGATKNRKRRSLLSDRGDRRAFTNATGTRRAFANATRFGQTSASTNRIRVGRMRANARRMIGQKSSGVYITSIHGGALLFATAKPVVVVVV